MNDPSSVTEVIKSDSDSTTLPTTRKKRKNKTVRIEIVVDEDEAKIIDDNAKKIYLNRSEYLRFRGLKRVYVRSREVPPIEIISLIQILRELKRQGNNLNQIARKLNSGKSATRTDDKPFNLTIHLETTKMLNKLLKEWQD
jgi:hypothetical protein